MRNKKGFTLIEIVVVIIIISILAAIGFISYNGAQKKVRDSKRASDLNSIASALELYKADKKKYPDLGILPGNRGDPAGCLSKECNNTNIPSNLSASASYEVNWLAFKNDMKDYLNPLPLDPRVGDVKDPGDYNSELMPFSYLYVAGDSAIDHNCDAGTCYKLFARPLETEESYPKCGGENLTPDEDSFGGSYICLKG